MVSRRDLLVGIGAGVGVTVLSASGFAWRRIRSVPAYEFGGIGAPIASASASDLTCTSGTVTNAQMEGPFYTPKTPERRDIRDPGVTTGLIVLAGRVVDSQCRPIAGAVLDFWQTDHNGVYDNQGYRYRGHQYTDAEGRYELVTVRPHAYTAMSLFRTPHFHVKVQGRTTKLLTTQLYLPDAEETNGRDRGYEPSLLVAYAGEDAPARRATFDFVLARG
jgi:protocatechuate 3,4-dioxygenase beta subunit